MKKRYSDIIKKHYYPLIQKNLERSIYFGEIEFDEEMNKFIKFDNIRNFIKYDFFDNVLIKQFNVFLVKNKCVYNESVNYFEFCFYIINKFNFPNFHLFDFESRFLDEKYYKYICV